MHPNSYYNQQPQQRHGGTATNGGHVASGPGPEAAGIVDVEHCRQPSSSSSSAGHHGPQQQLSGLVPGPRTNPHSYAKEYYGGTAPVAARYHGLSDGVATGVGAADKTAVVDVTHRPSCRQQSAAVDVGTAPCSLNAASSTSSCQYVTNQQYAVAAPSRLPPPVTDWSAAGSSGHGGQTPVRVGHLQHSSQQQQSQSGAVWMAGCADYRPQVNSVARSQFPESPPDSGSEPYSPPNDNRILAAAPPGGVGPHPSSQSAAAAAAGSCVRTAHMYMNQLPAHRSQYDHCLVAAAAAAAGVGGQSHYLPDQSSGGAAGYCMSRGPAGYGGNTGGGLYPHSAVVDPVKQLMPAALMATQLSAQALAAQYGGMHNAVNHPPKKKKVPTATLR